MSVIDLAMPLLPVLKQEQVAYWKDHPNPTLLAGQVEQESGWKVNATLKTDREFGAGLAQFTKTAAFDAIEELKKNHPNVFGDWSFKNPYTPRYQLRGLVVYMHDLSSEIRGASTPDDNYRMTLSAYNGGIGGLRKERLKCSIIPNCNPNVWYSNVELSSIKSHKAFKGYGQSPYDINRGYIKLVYERAKKYEGLY
jgi:membrane-bound lytic murein transglycosylase MltF